MTRTETLLLDIYGRYATDFKKRSENATQDSLVRLQVRQPFLDD